MFESVEQMKPGYKSSAKYLKKINKDDVIIGDGVGLVDIRKGTVVRDQKLMFPQAKNLAIIALGRYKKKKFVAVDKIIPLYLYPQDCQVRK